MARLDTPKDFGRYLQARRMNQGVSLEAISRLTRITTTCLKQIEGEDLASLPSPVFVKGFLRSYAEAVGADANQALTRYDACVKALEQDDHHQAQLSKRTPFRLRIFIALTLLAILIAATLFFERSVISPDSPVPSHTLATRNGSNENPQIAKTNDKPDKTEKEASITSTDTEAELAKKSVLSLKMEAVEPSWIKVISDDQKPQEYNLQVGETVVINAQSQFSLLIGNAAGVRLILNGKPVVVPGKRGQVVTLQLP